MKKVTRCSYCKKRFDFSETRCPYCGTEHVRYHDGDSALTWFKAHHYSTQGAPFLRFLARVLDVLLTVLVLEVCLGSLLARYMGGTNALQLLLFAGTVCEILVEPIFLSVFGYTLGKRLFGIAVRNRNGEKLTFFCAFLRAVGVLFYGLGILAPVISLFTLYFSYMRVSHHEPARWDENRDIAVFHKKKNVLLFVLGIVCIALLCWGVFYVSRATFSFYDSMIRK